MTLGFNILVATALAYVAFLFFVAFVAERRAADGQSRWLRSPYIYTLSLSVYCTAWTFYGAVGYAARSGLEYVTIYLGPTIVIIGWWWVLRKLVRIGRAQRVTSIADLISSRFGKSNTLGVLVTLLAVIGTTPYIALQLQSVTLSFAAFASVGDGTAEVDLNSTALWVAAGLALFTIVFGTRNLDANERHHGVVMAIAVEAVVKLFALVAVGIFVVWGVAGGISETVAAIDQSKIAAWQVPTSKWIGLTFLSAAAFLCLPRMFQVLVVENADEAHVSTASWAFPLYLLLISLFVVPIAAIGLSIMPAGSNPDLFVLTIPLSQGQNSLAVLSFLGGFSSATSMVIVAAIALSTMVSNHIVMPIWLSSQGSSAVVSGDVRYVLIIARRVSIGAVLLLGYLYYRLSGGGSALAAIGLISFTGVVQVLPALMGGVFWRGATRVGAISGLVVGFAVWAYTLFLPSFGASAGFGPDLMANGLFGWSWLRPQALMSISGLDPVIHALLWSMILNTVAFIVGSISSFPTPTERLQGAQFVNVFDHSTRAGGFTGGAPEAEDLLVMSQRILGGRDAQNFFHAAARKQGKDGYLPEITPDFLFSLERQLGGSVGAATAHAMIGQIVGGNAVSVHDLMAVADETAQMMEYSSRLEAQSVELTRTASQLRDANEKLTALSVQKDAFLSQISHELRTPMTSIRAFSEILRETDLSTDEKEKYTGIIHAEAQRLTRLLDDLLDLGVLENGKVNLNVQSANLENVLDHALSAAGADRDVLIIKRNRTKEDFPFVTDIDRLSQVIINIVSNTVKYCDADQPELRIAVHHMGQSVSIDFIDNGTGIPKTQQDVIFEKFSRLSDHKSAGSAGLGLAICREIMLKLGGTIRYLPGQGGAAFRLVLPIEHALVAQ